MKTSTEKFINALIKEAKIKRPADLKRLTNKYNWRIFGVKRTGGYTFVYLYEIVVGFFEGGSFQGIHEWNPNEDLEDYKKSDDFTYWKHQNKVIE